MTRSWNAPSSGLMAPMRRRTACGAGSPKNPGTDRPSSSSRFRDPGRGLEQRDVAAEHRVHLGAYDGFASRSRVASGAQPGRAALPFQRVP
ncbi:hypothetical protein ACFV27_35275 [Streptomyces antimycoticus]|uniref:hypothetical protein n=1 Tax=Streptomyces antimycoticus TaxID=68175 RepID=UPI00369A5D03